MTNAPARLRALIVAFALTLCFGMAANIAAAGQARTVVIPPRLPNVKEGDWILYKNDKDYSKETVTKIEEVEEDLVVYYTIERFDFKGKATEKQEVARIRSDEAAENAEFGQTHNIVKAERRKVKIDGKNLQVFVFTALEGEGDDAVRIEYWYSDDISVDGKVAMVVIVSDSETYTPFETAGFGDAKTKFNLKKYID